MFDGGSHCTHSVKVRSLGPGYPELSTAERAEGDSEHMLLPVNPMSALCLGHVARLPPFSLRHTVHGAHEDIPGVCPPSTKEQICQSDGGSLIY